MGGDELTLCFCTGGKGNALCKCSSAIDRTVTDRLTTFPLFWRQLCLLINKYNNLIKDFKLGKQLAEAISSFYQRLPCWGLLPSNLSPSYMKEYLKGQALF